MRALGYRDEAAYTTARERLEAPMLGLSVLFLVVLLARQVASQGSMQEVLGVVETTVWAAFALELFVLLWTAPSKRAAVRTHWLDAVIVLAPFLRVLRFGRVLRVARAGSIAGRAATALGRITDRRGFRGFLVVTGFAVVGLGVLGWSFEQHGQSPLIGSPLEGIWWALVTATTVGYGDLYPLTPEGRVVAGVLMILGVALLSTVTAAVAAYFVERDTEADLQAQISALEAKMDQVLERLPVAADADSG